MVARFIRESTQSTKFEMRSNDGLEGRSVETECPVAPLASKAKDSQIDR